jgi:hypothetical protein
VTFFPYVKFSGDLAPWFTACCRADKNVGSLLGWFIYLKGVAGLRGNYRKNFDF